MYLCVCVFVFVYLGEQVIGCRFSLQSYTGRAGPGFVFVCVVCCVFVFVYLGEWVMGCRVGLQSHTGRAGPAGTRAAPA